MNYKNEYFLVEKNELISNYLLDKFKLWVWDFDNTLLDTTTYYNKSMEPNDILMRTDDQLTEDIPNWIYFRSLVNYLISRGVRVAIASFGTFQIIKAYMDRIFGLNQNIFDTSNLKAVCNHNNGTSFSFLKNICMSSIFYQNKNNFIDSIMKHYKIYKPYSVVLFDDNMNNILDAINYGIVGVKIIGKNNDGISSLLSSSRNIYSKDSLNVFFGEAILNKLEISLKQKNKSNKVETFNNPITTQIPSNKLNYEYIIIIITIIVCGVSLFILNNKLNNKPRKRK